MHNRLFCGAKVIKNVESEKREVKSEVYSARDLFYGIDGTNGIDEGAERVSLENLRNLRSLARCYRHLLQSLTANLVPKFPKFPSLPSSFSAPINSSPCPPHLAHYFSSEVPRFGTKSKLHWKGVYLAYISLQGNELGGEDWCLSREINFLLEGLQMWP